MTPFVFTENPRSLFGGDALVLEVQRGLENKRALLEWYAGNLRFPGYFGRNWDALDDCLRDLSWIGERRIVLYHADIPPLANEADRKTYLNILGFAVTDWKDDGTHELIAAFHPATRSWLEALHADGA